jgi:hypothetical protein
VKVTEIVVVPFSKNWGLTAKNAGTVNPLALLRGTAFMMIGPLSAVVADENALRFDLTPVNSYLPVVPLIDPLAGDVGSPEVAFVSAPVVLTPIPNLETVPRPKPISAASILLAVVPELVTVAVIDKTYDALLRSFSGTWAMTKLFVLPGPSSPRLIDTASGEFVTPSVVTPPPELPVRVTAPPELISTNFETVALMLTVPVVDCPKQETAEIISDVVSNINLLIRIEVERGILCLLEEELRYGHPAVSQ